MELFNTKFFSLGQEERLFEGRTCWQTDKHCLTEMQVKTRWIFLGGMMGIELTIVKTVTLKTVDNGFSFYKRFI